MDPISQGTFGGVFSQFFSSKKKLTVATVIGIISGLAPDLDVFIKSSYDPLLSLEFTDTSLILLYLYLLER